MDDMIDYYSADAATFGDRVAAAREGAGMTQAQLAKRLGIRVATVRGWEDDLSEPRANRLSMLAGVLNVSIMWLINGEGEGMDAPDSAGEIDTDLKPLLDELRDMRTTMAQQAEALGRLEKRLRATLRAKAGE